MGKRRGLIRVCGLTGAVLIAGWLTIQSADVAAQETEADTPFRAEPADASATARTGPPPVLVLSVPDDQLAPPVAEAIQRAVVETLTPMVQRRPVVPVTGEQTVAAARACEVPECIGAIIAGSGGVLGVVVRASQSNLRSPVIITLDVVDPVSGTSRLTAPIEGSIEPEQVAAPGPVIQSMMSSLGSHMPSAPPRTSLLITSNVDGATVSINGQPVGETPLPPGQTRPGRYQVQVTRDGFMSQSRDVEITEGEAARVDVSLSPNEETERMDSAGLDYREQAPPNLGEDDSVTSEWWFWAAIGGAAVIAIGAVILVVSAGGEEILPPRDSILIPGLR